MPKITGLRKPRWISTAARLVLRRLKIQTLVRWKNWTTSKEEPKVILYRTRYLVAVSALFPHILAIFMAIALLVLNINAFYFEDLSPSAISAFQFAGKGLEMLMQASLAIILYDTIRYQIVRHKDFPMGALVAALQTTQISYPFSPEFRGALTSKNWRGCRKLYLALLICATVILAAVVGPSCAVALVPRRSLHLIAHDLLITDPQLEHFPHVVSCMQVFELFM
jgi:hypothetical protein